MYYLFIFLTFLLQATASNAFATLKTSLRNDAILEHNMATKTSLNLFTTKNKTSERNLLPKVDPENPERYVPPTSFSSSDFYSPSLSLLRAGPLPLLTRITNPDKYEQAVLKYMYQSKEVDIEEAQANMDAFFSAPDVWAEQKMLERQGKREVYKYGKAGIQVERTILSVIWAGVVFYIVGKIVFVGILGF